MRLFFSQFLVLISKFFHTIYKNHLQTKTLHPVSKYSRITEKKDIRTQAASNLIAEMSSNVNLTEIMSRYSTLSASLIQLAYITVPPKMQNKENVSIPIDRAASITKIANWQNIAVPTDCIPVRPDGDYSNVAGIRNFSPSYTLCGGINAPKKITCMGTDGKLRIQLVKGKHYLRAPCLSHRTSHL